MRLQIVWRREGFGAFSLGAPKLVPILMRTTIGPDAKLAFP